MHRAAVVRAVFVLMGLALGLAACTAATPPASAQPPVGPPPPPPSAAPPAAPSAAPSPTAAPRLDGRQLVAYYPQWGVYDRKYFVKNIDTSGSADKLTVINYAFGNVVDGQCQVGVTQSRVGDAMADYQQAIMFPLAVDGVSDSPSDPLRGNWNQLKKLKAKYPQLKVVMAIGGWTWSGGFSDAALPERRAAFVASCIDAYIRGNLPFDAIFETGGPGAAAGLFDGIDVDWEFPAVCGNPDNCKFRPEDTQNFTALLAEFRKQLDAVRPGLLLTIAAPANEEQYSKLELGKISAYVDWINVMSYDYRGAWKPNGPTDFHSPLYTSPRNPYPAPEKDYSADQTISAYLAAGVPANKLVMGVPFYGRGWTGVTDAGDGLYQSAKGPARGKYEAGIDDYKRLKSLGLPGFRDTQYTQAYWVFDGKTFWSFDDPISLATKLDYIRRKGLLGAMAWELSGDTPEGELITAMYQGLK
jgi:chitinase